MDSTEMVEQQFEPGVRSLRAAQSFEPVALASIAISLKRIADAVTGQGTNIFTTPVNAYGEGISEALQNALVRGAAGIQHP